MMAQAIRVEELVGRQAAHPRELAMSAAWSGALQRRVDTTDGRSATVIFHGRWSHGYGPDFIGAMLDFGDSHLLCGDIEIHTQTSEWYSHGHHLDPAYNNVVLHIVRNDNAEPVRTEDGRIVPTAILRVPDEALFAIDRTLPTRWAEFGGSVCAANLAGRNPAVLLQAIHRLGDERLLAKSAVIESTILEDGADAALLRALFGGFGYSANRAPMEHLADLVLRYQLNQHPKQTNTETPSPWLMGVLLGLGGFLPLAPADAHAAGILPEDQYAIERSWQGSAPGFAGEFVPAISWQTARVRPANHPAYRILQIATLLTRTSGDLTDAFVSCLMRRDDPVILLQQLTSRPWHPGLGKGRATAIVASVLLPFAHAYAMIEGDDSLEDAVMRKWATLRHAEWTQPARRALQQVTGGPTLRGLGERGHQGLLRLDRDFCAPRTCNACPIAHAVLRDQVS